MADCLTYCATSYSSGDIYRSLNVCSDETAFTDDEGKEVTSLLDDLAEAKRHISTDDIDNDTDADCISLWDDVEQWTTKDSDSGPTLAELNGGELTDLEQYEPLQIATKRKRSRSSVSNASPRNARSLMIPVQICDIIDAASAFKQKSIIADRSTNQLQHHEETPVPLGEQQDVKPNRKVYQKFVPDTQFKSVSLPNQQKEGLRNMCDMPASYSKHDLPFNSKHSRKVDAPESVYDFYASKKMKTNHEGLYLLFKF